jgi:hypothetical protein
VLALIVIALVIWIVLALLGFLIHGLFWLAIIGIVLFLITVGFGASKRSSLRR